MLGVVAVNQLRKQTGAKTNQTAASFTSITLRNNMCSGQKLSLHCTHKSNRGRYIMTIPGDSSASLSDSPECPSMVEWLLSTIPDRDRRGRHKTGLH